MEKYFTGQDFTVFDSNGDASIVQRIMKLEWDGTTLFAHLGLEDSNSDTSYLPTLSFPFNPVPTQIATGEVDSDGNALYDFRAGDAWDSSGPAFNYVEKELGLIT
jgi:hypothetical protein